MVIMHPKLDTGKNYMKHGLVTLKSIVLLDRKDNAFCRYLLLLQTLTELAVTL